jgi:hypothetical protein
MTLAGLIKTRLAHTLKEELRLEVCARGTFALHNVSSDLQRMIYALDDYKVSGRHGNIFYLKQGDKVRPLCSLWTGTIMECIEEGTTPADNLYKIDYGERDGVHTQRGYMLNKLVQEEVDVTGSIHDITHAIEMEADVHQCDDSACQACNPYAPNSMTM